MNTIAAHKLHQSNVVFNEQHHTYTLPGGRVLSGVTSLIKAVLFPDKYKGIPEDILKRAADRGTAIHNECENIDLLGESALSFDSSPEARAYQRLKDEHAIRMVANEYLVSDGRYIATMIDCIDERGNLYDIKTTRSLDIDSLSWQLSFCDWLFERQNIFLDRPERKLYGIWLRGDEAKLVEVERKSDDDLQRVLDAWLAGQTLDLTPKLKGQDAELVALEEMESVIIEFKEAIDRLEQEKKRHLEQLRSRMELEGIKKIETPRLLVTLVADSTTSTLDTKRLKEDHPELVSQYSRESVRKGYVKITLR